MNSVSSAAAAEFCKACNWAYECWVTHKRLFDENKKFETTIGRAPYFADRLLTITQEYSLLQICKLHDPAIQGGTINITLDYIVRFCNWGGDVERINGHVERLTSLFEQLKSARNKVLAHNDLQAAMESATLGEFPEGLDDAYFSTLQELVNVVHERFVGGIFPFNDLAAADVDEFLHLLEKAK